MKERFFNQQFIKNNFIIKQKAIIDIFQAK